MAERTTQQANFSWAAAIDVGLGALSGLGGALSALASNKVAKANAEAANTIREAQNVQKASANSLAGTIRSINNKRIMESMRKNMDAVVTNSVRTGEAFTRGNFEETIRGAERMGATQARLAASGLGGSGIDAIARTAELTQARATEQRMSQQGQVSYEQARALVGMHSSALGQMDISPIGSAMDRSTNTAPQTDWLGQVVTGLLSKKDSLHTLLGSFGRTEVREGAQAFPVTQGTAVGSPLATFEWADEGAVSYPVRDNNVRGTDLGQLGSTGSITLN